MVTVYTQVYNTEAYIRQCVESVLNQTYPYFEYYLIDNGSTDGCKEILREYAAADRRIKLIRHEKNAIPPLGAKIPRQHGVGRYYTALDSDDWWEPDYLEKLLAFAEKNRLDIACTGSIYHCVATGDQSPRKVNQPVVFPREKFAQGLPWYHAFFRPVWGKLVRMDCLRLVDENLIPPIVYGADTAWCFQFLRHAKRIGIDNSILHHYRIFSRSLSYRYNTKRFESDVYLYNDAIDFLANFGPVSAKNRDFLQAVYSNAVVDTADVIAGSDLSADDKLREYCVIASYPLTQAVYRGCRHESADRSKAELIRNILKAGAALDGRPDENLRGAMRALLPRCGRAVSGANAQIYLEDPELYQALTQDNPDIILKNLLGRMEKKQGVKKYAIPKAIQALAANKPLLCHIDDAVFLRKYAGVYWEVWQGELLEALERMTGLLLDNQVSSGREIFLELYISLGATLEQVPAFLFGKLQLAKLYLRQNKAAQCRSIVEDLSKMGLDNEEFASLQHELEHTAGQ